jgi:hypothetical protein
MDDESNQLEQTYDEGRAKESQALPGTTARIVELDAQGGCSTRRSN